MSVRQPCSQRSLFQRPRVCSPSAADANNWACGPPRPMRPQQQPAAALAQCRPPEPTTTRAMATKFAGMRKTSRTPSSSPCLPESPSSPFRPRTLGAPTVVGPPVAQAQEAPARVRRCTMVPSTAPNACSSPPLAYALRAPAAQAAIPWEPSLQGLIRAPLVASSAAVVRCRTGVCSLMALGRGIARLLSAHALAVEMVPHCQPRRHQVAQQGLPSRTLQLRS
mmetsp:Transcript_86678/g.248674  ORF Transcript_86678/g.248674 Transcript_86678/m.248674 type:complete len:223 (-) Transcript_86678:2183-2851(-)